MPTSLAEREASCAHKGQNRPSDCVNRTAYSVGSNVTVTQKHFGQSSLMLLHINTFTHLYQIPYIIPGS